jgi:hypothetical protein
MKYFVLFHLVDGKRSKYAVCSEGPIKELAIAQRIATAMPKSYRPIIVQEVR